jgi:hypothetical protein
MHPKARIDRFYKRTIIALILSATTGVAVVYYINVPGNDKETKSKPRTPIERQIKTKTPGVPDPSTTSRQVPTTPQALPQASPTTVTPQQPSSQPSRIVVQPGQETVRERTILVQPQVTQVPAPQQVPSPVASVIEPEQQPTEISTDVPISPPPDCNSFSIQNPPVSPTECLTFTGEIITVYPEDYLFLEPVRPGG